MTCHDGMTLCNIVLYIFSYIYIYIHINMYIYIYIIIKVLVSDVLDTIFGHLPIEIPLRKII